jgi:CoA:oxalate CoA-transferase
VYPTAAYKFSKTPWAGGRAPLLGEHNQEIYCERLGYSQQDLARLADSKVI